MYSVRMVTTTQIGIIFVLTLVQTINMVTVTAVSSLGTEENQNLISSEQLLLKRTGAVHHGTGSSCVVKGSYCQCHYCKCEKGQLHCRAKGLAFNHGFGKYPNLLTS